MKKFAKTHEWINIENGEVGITENAIELLGDIVFLELPEAGKEISKESPIAVVESCLLYTSPSPRDGLLSRMPSSA